MIRCRSGILYIDPWKLSPSSPKADIILLTHDHYDHCSHEDLLLLKGDATRIAAPMQAPHVTDIIGPGEKLAFGSVAIEAMPAYNISKSFHPRAKSWVGYVVEADGRRIYHAGDTDRIPEMKGLKVDLAFVPVGGTFTMDAREAAGAMEDIQAGEVVPIHFGDIVGSRQDAETFARSCAGAVRILDPGEPHIIS
jgi:L-ascorbate metabolism protein UlaG (beta-lactamase superfamily)